MSGWSAGGEGRGGEGRGREGRGGEGKGGEGRGGSGFSILIGLTKTKEIIPQVLQHDKQPLGTYSCKFSVS